MDFEITVDIQYRVSKTRTGVRATVVAFVMGLVEELTPADVLEVAAIVPVSGERVYVVGFNQRSKQYFACSLSDAELHATVGYAEEMAYLITTARVPDDDPAVIRKGIYAFRTLTGSSVPVWIDKDY